MLGLPEGWESDYDGQRWFYRYKPNGLTQFQFPKPGDEFPAFVGDNDNVELEPEERLASERQLRERNGGEAKRSGSGRKKAGGTAKGDEFGMGATGYFDPSSFMYFGPDDEDEAGSVADEVGDERNGTAGSGQGESPTSTTDSIQSPEPTPSTVKSELATSPLVATDNSTDPIDLVVELSADSERKKSPVGLVAELAGPHTAKCAEELAPIELDAVSSVSPSAAGNSLHREVAELSADNPPIKRKKTPPPRPPPVPIGPVDSYPLVSASFAYPPLRNVGNSGNPTARKVEEPQVPKQSDVPRERAMSAGEGQAKYQPFMPGQRVTKDTTETHRSSMILSSTTVLQSQNSELGHIDSKKAQKPAPVLGLGRPKMFEPPVDPKRASIPGPLQVPQRTPSPDDPPRDSRLPPLPGSGARHESISSHPGQAKGDSNANLYYAPSVLKPAHRRSNLSISQLQQSASREPGPAKSEGISIVPSDQAESISGGFATYEIENTSSSAKHQSLPTVASVAPLRPRKSPSPKQAAPAPFLRPPLPHSSRSMPDTLDQIDHAISELGNLNPSQGSPRPPVDATSTIQRTNYHMGSPSACQLKPPQNHTSSLTEAAAVSNIISMPPVLDAQGRNPLLLEASPMHTPDPNEQRSSSRPFNSVDSTSSLASQGMGLSSTSIAAKEPTEGYSQPLPPVELPSHSSVPLSSAQSQVSSPAQSLTSLHREPSAASSHHISQLPSVPTPGAVHELPTTSDRSSLPPGAGAAQLKPKPFPMLPGQVKPMPSQIGSDPVPIKPIVDEPVETNTTSPPKRVETPQPQSLAATASTSQLVQSQPLTLAGSNRVSLQQYSQLLPQLQMKPGQQMVAQWHPTSANMQTGITQQGHQGPSNLHMGPMAMKPPVLQQNTAHYPPPGPRSNRAPATSDAGRGMKKWAKKIFKNSSTKQNAAIVGGLGPESAGAANDGQHMSGVSNSVPMGTSFSQPQQGSIAHSHAQFAPAQAQTPLYPQTTSAAIQAHPTPTQILPQQSTTRPRSQTQQPQMSNSGRPTSYGQTNGGPILPTGPRASVSDTVVNTISNIEKTAVTAQAHHRHSLSATTNGPSRNTTPTSSPPRLPNQLATNGASSKMIAQTTAPRPTFANTIAPIMGPSSNTSHGGNGWKAKGIDYSGGDWGDDWQ